MENNNTMTYNEDLYMKAGEEMYSNTCFILDNYKSSTLIRLIYDYGMTVKQIDKSELITNWLNSVEAMERGYTQDDLFNVLFTETYYGKEVLRNAEPSELPF